MYIDICKLAPPITFFGFLGPPELRDHPDPGCEAGGHCAQLRLGPCAGIRAELGARNKYFSDMFEICIYIYADTCVHTYIYIDIHISYIHI